MESHKEKEFIKPFYLSKKDWKIFSERVISNKDDIVRLKGNIDNLHSQVNELKKSLANAPNNVKSDSSSNKIEETFSAKVITEKSHQIDESKLSGQILPQDEKSKDNNEVKFEIVNNCEKEDRIHYTYIRVVDGGKLVETASNENSYYRAWKERNVFYFEFSSFKIEKAINNRSSLIEPFCNVDPSSVHPDQASSIKVIEKGQLNDDFSVKTKGMIKYC